MVHWMEAGGGAAAAAEEDPAQGGEVLDEIPEPPSLDAVAVRRHRCGRPAPPFPPCASRLAAPAPRARPRAVRG